jgi:predicted PurR-regulated permease PerM
MPQAAPRERIRLVSCVGRPEVKSSHWPQVALRGELRVQVLSDSSTEALKLSGRPDRQLELIAWSVGLIAATAVGLVLYTARELLLPIAAAFVIGTMLSPVAKFAEEHRVPRLASALLIVLLVAGLVPTAVASISAPLTDWASRAPELVRDRLHAFDGALRLWRSLQLSAGLPPDAGAPSLPLPNFEWVRSAIAFLTPTLAEFLFFLVVLLLFIAGWPDLRRGLVMALTQREARLLALKILNEIESSLASYLLTVTLINLCLGAIVGLLCAVTAMPNPIGLGLLAATLNFVPIIGPISMVAVLLILGIATAPTIAAGTFAAIAFAVVAGLEGQFVTPSIIGRHLSLNGLAVLLSLAFWTWLWGPTGAFLSSPLLIVGLILHERLSETEEAGLDA